jgi:hypothetical protein
LGPRQARMSTFAPVATELPPRASPPLHANRRPEQVQQRARIKLRLLDHLIGEGE